MQKSTGLPLASAEDIRRVCGGGVLVYSRRESTTPSSAKPKKRGEEPGQGAPSPEGNRYRNPNDKHHEGGKSQT